MSVARLLLDAILSLFHGAVIFKKVHNDKTMGDKLLFRSLYSEKQDCHVAIMPIKFERFSFSSIT